MASLAISTRHLPTDACPVCLELLDSQIARLGAAVIHSGPRGVAHPFHRECLLQAIRVSQACPLCREVIPIEAFDKSTVAKISYLVMFTLAGAQFHYLGSSLTGSPTLVAIIPVIAIAALMGKNIIDEAREVGLAEHLKMRTVGIVLISSILISTLIASSYIAENVTDSEALRSIIIVGIFNISIMGLLTLDSRF